MKIEVNIDRKLMPKDKDGNRKEIINYIISYPDHRGRIRYYTEDEIKEIALNLQEVVKEIDLWHEKNPEKEEVSES